MNRLRTGVENLDELLGGGFPEASINIIGGQPGSGKTMLAQQLVYHLATPQRKALYLSTVNEPLHKMLRFVQGFSFFDESKVGTAVVYEDLGPRLVDSSSVDTLRHVEEMVMREQPAFLVIDSFRALSEMARDPVSFRQALFRLTGVLTATGCTAFFVGEYGAQEILNVPEAAVADGILLIQNERRGIRTFRFLNVVKLRGSEFADGLHAIRLTPEGFRIFPRFRTPPRPRDYERSSERVPTGSAMLDRMTNGGLLRGSTSLVAGPAGAGKTHLSLAFTFEALARGEKVLFASLGEDPTQLAKVAAEFGWDVEGAIKEGSLDLMYASPVEADLDEHVLAIMERLRDSGAQHLVLDSLSDLENMAFDRDRFMGFVYSLTQMLKDNGLTAMLTFETIENMQGVLVATKNIARIVDNVVLLGIVREGNSFHHEAIVSKSRGSAHSYDVQPFRITSDGARALNGEAAAEPSRTVELAGRKPV